MRYLLPILTLAFALAAPGLAPAAERPNVVVILSDDQGWTDYGFMGHEDIKTPHLDKLAAQSVVFERGYVAAPLCRPSLASMVTGRYPFDHGITGNDVDGNNNRAALDVPLRDAFNKGGFTHGMTHGDPKRGGRHGDAGLVIGREGLKPISDFLDLAVTEKKPFLLWYAPFLPHTPHNPPRRLLDKYSSPGRPADVARYFAMCGWFDETCGDLLGQLDRRGLSKNTLVIYLCDNGWAATSTNAADPNQKLWKGYALRSKSSPYETGIRTPIMLSWPGRIEPGRSQDLAHAIDLFPTIAAATGIAAPPDLPGIDLLDAKARQERDTVFGVCHSVHNMTPGNPDGTLQYLWCISGDWKLLLRHDGEDTTDYKNIHLWDKQPARLYHLKDDPNEKNELSSAHPEIVEKLRKKTEAWHPVVVK